MKKTTPKRSALGAFLDQFRKDRSERGKSDLSRWWAVAGDLAAGRKPKISTTEMAELSIAIDRPPSELEADVALLTQLHIANEAATGLEKAKESVREMRRVQEKAHAKAAELEREIARIRGEADTALERSKSTVRRAEKGAEDAARLTRDLAKRGHPGSVEAIQAREAAEEPERLLGQLRSLRAGVNTSGTQSRSQRIAEVTQRLRELGVPIPPDPRFETSGATAAEAS